MIWRFLSAAIVSITKIPVGHTNELFSRTGRNCSLVLKIQNLGSVGALLFAPFFIQGPANCGRPGSDQHGVEDCAPGQGVQNNPLHRGTLHLANQGGRPWGTNGLRPLQAFFIHDMFAILLPYYGRHSVTMFWLLFCWRVGGWRILKRCSQYLFIYFGSWLCWPSCGAICVSMPNGNAQKEGIHEAIISFYCNV